MPDAISKLVTLYGYKVMQPMLQKGFVSITLIM